MSDRNIITVEGTDRQFHRHKILLVLLLPLAMSLMAVSSVNVALFAIETGLDATASDLQWVLSGYALAFGLFLIPAGRAGDVLGRGSLFIIGLALFVAASLMAGLAPTALVLNIARILQGVGAGLFNPQITGMIQQYFDGPGRAKAFALFGLVISVSVAIGPVVAGALIAALGAEDGWRSAFLFNIPLGVLGLILGMMWFPFGNERRILAALKEAKKTGAQASLERIDLDPVGMVLLGGAVLLLMWPFMNKGNPWLWLLLLGSAALLAAWLRWERRYTRRGNTPMVDLAMFRIPSFSLGTSMSAIMFVGTTSTFVLIALYLQSGLGVNALVTGLIGLPNAIVSAFASMWAGGQVFKRGRIVVIAGLISMTVGIVTSIAVVFLVDQYNVSFWWLTVTLIFNGWGMGVIGAANQTLTLLDISREDGGVAGGIKQTFERIGTAIGNAVITGVFFGVQAIAGWAPAFMVGFGAIGVVLLMALGVATFDWYYHRALEWRKTDSAE